MAAGWDPARAVVFAPSMLVHAMETHASWMENREASREVRTRMM